MRCRHAALPHRSSLWRPALLALAAAGLALAACGGSGRDGEPVAIGSGVTTVGNAASNTPLSATPAASSPVVAADQLLLLKVPYEISTRLHGVAALPTPTGDSAAGQLRTMAQFCPGGGSFATTFEGAAVPAGGTLASKVGTFQTVYSGCNTGSQLINGSVTDVALESSGLMISLLTLANYRASVGGVQHSMAGSYRYARDTEVSGLDMEVMPAAGATMSGTPFGTGITFVSGTFAEADLWTSFYDLRYLLAGVQYVATGSWSRTAAGQPLNGTVVVSNGNGGVLGYLRMANDVLHIESP